jgi:peptidoglycan lytic transglycosylase
MSQRSLGTWLVLAAVLLCGALVVIGLSEVSEQRTLPLADTSIIRTQAADKRLDPALIAAVIYCESKFEPHPS